MEITWKAPRKCKSWARFNFYIYASPSIHCFHFIYASKTYVHKHVKLIANDELGSRCLKGQCVMGGGGGGAGGGQMQ